MGTQNPFVITNKAELVMCKRGAVVKKGEQIGRYVGTMSPRGCSCINRESSQELPVIVYQSGSEFIEEMVYEIAPLNQQGIGSISTTRKIAFGHERFDEYQSLFENPDN